MTFLDQFRADLKKATQDHQRDLVVAVLKRRARDLTLGDLRKLLASQHGKDLDNVMLVSLFAANENGSKSTPVAKAKPTTADKPTAPGRRKAAKAKTAAKAKPKARVKSTRVSQQTIEAVTRVLTTSGRTLKLPEIVEKTGLHRKTVLKALKQLTKDGVVVASPGGDASEGAKMAGTAKAPVQPASSDEEKLDADVIAAMLAARDPVASSVIQKATGASLTKVRASLQRLIKKGRAYRVGERRFTRYGLNVLAEPR